MQKHSLALVALLMVTVLRVPAQDVSSASPRLNLMPWPKLVTSAEGALPITEDFTISLNGAGAADPRVQSLTPRILHRLTTQTGVLLKSYIPGKEDSAKLSVRVSQKDGEPVQKLGDTEHYTLTVGAQGALLTADGPLGVLRGMETFLQLIQQNKGGAPGFSLPYVRIDDTPRFEWRGLSLDVSRHFITISSVERTLDGMAAVKLNVFHWHLSDDQGFRVESRRLPKLQELSSDGLFYTQAQVHEVLAYARDRGIRVVPEFDMPGHAASWLAAYPDLAAGPGPYAIWRGYGISKEVMDPTRESTYKLLDSLIGEMAQLFPDAYFHIGGDEVNPGQWNNSPTIQQFEKAHQIKDAPALQTYFNQRILKIVTKHGKRVEGWDEVLQPSLPKTIVIESWRGQESLWQAANQGFDGILAAGYYLDLMGSAAEHYAVDPMKLPPPSHNDGVATATTPQTLTDAERKHILGGEAAMWEELDTDQNLDTRLWPRLAVIAERFWSQEDITSVSSMYRRLAAVNGWLEYLGLQQRSALALMHQRLNDNVPSPELDALAALLTPVKGYERDADKNTAFTQLNRLVDSVAPESDQAREFNDTVDLYLKTPHTGTSGALLTDELQQWEKNAADARTLLASHAILRADVPAAEAVEELCKTGTEAIAAIEAGRSETSEWKQRSEQLVKTYSGRVGDLLVPMSAGVQKLVDAASVSQ